jgi:hypothetical protein
VGVECFVTSTAARVSCPSLTHKNKTALFNGGKMGEVSRELQRNLKGISTACSRQARLDGLGRLAAHRAGAS